MINRDGFDNKNYPQKKKITSNAREKKERIHTMLVSQDLCTAYKFNSKENLFKFE